MTGGITIVGLGPGDPMAMTLEGRTAIDQAARVCLRTTRHPAGQAIAEQREVVSFDELYETIEGFDEVYQEIVRRVVGWGEAGEVVYAVPGDPMVGEATTQGIVKAAAERGIAVRLVHAASFLEPTLAVLGVDALDGVQIADALVLGDKHYPPLSPDRPAVIGQVYSRLVASELKLTLLAQYPPGHPVWLIDAAGSEDTRHDVLALEDLDRNDFFSHATSVFVPPLEAPSSFESFLETIAHLRAPDGCPWDREQTHESLRTHLMEEAYEALEAIDSGHPKALREELGDLLLQIVLHAQIASEAGDFTMPQVIAAIEEKIVRRHPHVFGELKVGGVDEVLHNWEGLKADERNRAGGGRGALDGVPKALPALSQALEVQARAARLGFDWRTIEGVRAKLEEELAELAEVTESSRREDEIGDLLFAVVNLARWLRVDPESALRACNRRFRRRFAVMESRAAAEGVSLGELDLPALESLWQEAKRSDSSEA